MERSSNALQIGSEKIFWFFMFLISLCLGNCTLEFGDLCSYFGCFGPLVILDVLENIALSSLQVKMF